MKKVILLLFVLMVSFAFVSCTNGGYYSISSTPASTVKREFIDYLNDYRRSNGKADYVQMWFLTQVAQEWVDYQASSLPLN